MPTAQPTVAQHARIALTIGDRASLTVEVGVTPSGLLAIGALVSSILLSSAAIVSAARRPATMRDRGMAKERIGGRR